MVNPNFNAFQNPYPGMGMTYNQNPYNNYGYNQQQGTLLKDFLTDEEKEKLTRNTNEFMITLTEEDKAVARCRHITKDGHAATVRNPDGSFYCPICKKNFRILGVPNDKNPEEANFTMEDAKNIIDRYIDLMQTIKIKYVDCPIEVGREIFLSIPIAEKFKTMYDLAEKNFIKYNGYDTNNSYGSQPFQNEVVPFMNMFGFGNVMYQNPYQQPMGGGYGYAGSATPNPFGGPGGPQPQQQQFMNQQPNPGYMYTPPMTGSPVQATVQQPQPQQQQVIDVEAAPKSEEGSTTVKENFKI